jgi:hypothetical protein
MSNTRKEQRKYENESNASTTTDNPSQVQQHSINIAFNETKNNIGRATDEARKDIPRYTQAANEYQEQTIQRAREIADNFMESQKEIINSVQLTWLPLIQRTYSMFWDYCLSPRWAVDMYARAIGSVADNTLAAARLVNNGIFSNLDSFRSSIQNTRDNLKEFSTIGVNAARAYQQTSRDTANKFI